MFKLVVDLQPQREGAYWTGTAWGDWGRHYQCARERVWPVTLQEVQSCEDTENVHSLDTAAESEGRDEIFPTTLKLYDTKMSELGWSWNNAQIVSNTWRQQQPLPKSKQLQPKCRQTETSMSELASYSSAPTKTRIFVKRESKSVQRRVALRTCAGNLKWLKWL